MFSYDKQIYKHQVKQMYHKLLKTNKEVLFNTFFLTCVKSWTRSIEQAFYIFTVIGQNQIAHNRHNKQFALKALHGLHKLRGLNTNTLNPGDLSKPSAIVYVWIGPQGLHQPFMSFLFSFFFAKTFSLVDGWINDFQGSQERNGKGEIKQAEKREADRQREKEFVWKI